MFNYKPLVTGRAVFQFHISLRSIREKNTYCYERRFLHIFVNGVRKDRKQFHSLFAVIFRERG